METIYAVVFYGGLILMIAGCIIGVGGNQSNRVKASRYCSVKAVRR